MRNLRRNGNFEVIVTEGKVAEDGRTSLSGWTLSLGVMVKNGSL